MGILDRRSGVGRAVHDHQRLLQEGDQRVPAAMFGVDFAARDRQCTSRLHHVTLGDVARGSLNLRDVYVNVNLGR